MKITFLMTHIPDPRMNKRIRILKSCGDIAAICVRRKEQDIWEPNIKGIKYDIFDMDMPSLKHFFARIKSSVSFRNKAYKALNKNRPDCIYADGFDALMIASGYKRKHPNCKVIVEIADIREIFLQQSGSIFQKSIKKIVDAIEKKCFQSVDRLVITSEKFYLDHYAGLVPKEHVYFIPNVPETDYFKQYQKKKDGKFTVGFIGGIRYLKQMKILVEAAGEAGVEVLFAGAGGTKGEYEEIRAYCRERDYVTFTGKYNYNKEIANLYGSVDCVYAVYDAENPNVRIALPNKLYESIYCELPILVAENTYLSELVTRWNVGISVSHEKKEELLEAFRRLSLKDDYYTGLTDGCKRAKKEIFSSKWYQDLINYITKEQI